MNTGDYFQAFRQQLFGIYDPREAEQIAHLVFEQVTGMTRTDRILQKDRLLDEQAMEQLDHALRELLMHKPVQYVTGEAWFCGLRFAVNESVLIPRPETEELVEWVLQSVPDSQLAVGSSQWTTNPPSGSPIIAHRSPDQPYRLLDIGTGSGCIAIALKKRLPDWMISALDISEEALAVARENARANGTGIDMIRADILDTRETTALPRFDIIISNPPYIRLSEKEAMQLNVTEYEPEIALFVPDQDPLLFYRAIAHLALKKLIPGGQLFFEINESLGKEVAEMLTGKGFSPVEIRNDLSGKQRIVKGGLRI